MRQGGTSLLYNTYGKSKGRSGSYSTNYQNTGRELLTPGEVRMLDNQYALLFLRGERPILDKKYDIIRHPNVVFTPDGGGVRFVHGEIEGSRGRVEILWDVDPKNLPELVLPDTESEIYSEEDLEQLLFNNKKEGVPNETKS